MKEQFPTIIINSTKNSTVTNGLFRVFYDELFSLEINEDCKNKFIIHNDDHFFLFSHASIRFRKIIETNINHFLNQEYLTKRLIAKLDWGFVLIYSKSTNRILIYNDVYGIYPLFYAEQDGSIFISNNFGRVTERKDRLSFNDMAIYDFLLFNYTLNNRTLVKDIFQLVGGSSIKISPNSYQIEKKTDFAKLIRSFGKQKHNPYLLADSFSNCISENIDDQLSIKVPLTGGFDSKIVLSSILKTKLEFSAYTFGVEGSADNVMAKSITEKFEIDYQFMKFGNDISINERIQQFIEKSPSPILMTLVYYTLLDDYLPPSNIITGKMGGEIITGPVVISEVISTRTAKAIITSSSEKETIRNLSTDIKDLNFIDERKFNYQLNAYAKTLTNYNMKRKDSYKNEFLNFLANEMYAKFFGIVFSNVFPQHNLVNPFMDINFLGTLLNSKHRFTKNKAFTKSPLAHFATRKIYAQIVQKQFKPVLDTYLDRGYKLKDLLHWYTMPMVIKRYIKNHYLTKKPTLSSDNPGLTDFTILQNKVLEELRQSEIIDMNIFDKKKLIESIDNLENGTLKSYHARKLILLLGLHYFKLKYKIN